MATAGAHFWSTTAASNATADSAVSWPEGMAPSSVNDSARAMMASFAKWRLDNNGSLTTGGISTAYTVTTNQSFPSLSAMDGATLRLKFNAANGATPTLNVDGLGAKTIAIIGSTSIIEGYLINTGVYDLLYVNADNAWVVVNSTYQFFTAGVTLPFFQAAAPSGWTKSTSNDNAAIRIVSGTGGGTGGSANFTTALGSRTIAKVNLPSYNLELGSLSIAADVSVGSLQSMDSGGGGTNFTNMTRANNLTPLTASLANGSVGGTLPLGGSGTAMDFAVKYLDFIVCAKA
jgi:hypothetical protein